MTWYVEAIHHEHSGMIKLLESDTEAWCDQCEAWVSADEPCCCACPICGWNDCCCEGKNE